MDALLLLQDKIQTRDRTPRVVKPRFDPAADPTLGVTRLARPARPVRL
jgi:hypothetical protein